jgi:Tol biopolymer transport system component
MTHNDGFDRTISEWLDDQAGQGSPGYLAEILARTTRTRQRPAWSSLERWLPVRAPMKIMLLPRIAWLLIVAGLIIGLATVAILVGSRPRLPGPFGLAGNGTLAYGAQDGDIYVLDSATGRSQPLVADPAKDETPSFSRDGSTFVFARESETPGLWRLMLADADGTNIRPLTQPIYPTWNEWSPSGTQIVVVDTSAITGRLFLYHVDGSPPTLLDIGDLEPSSVVFRTTGDELVFRGSKAGLHGLYTIHTNGTGLRSILPPTGGDLDWQEPALSPDGKTVAYTSWKAGPPRSPGRDPVHAAVGSIHLLDLDDGLDRAVELDGSTTTDGWPQWSPDGTLLVFQRYFGGSYRLAVASVGGGPVTETGPVFPEGTGGAVIGFSPDGSQVMARFDADGSTWILDVHGGLGKHYAIDNTQSASWQRVTP